MVRKTGFSGGLSRRGRMEKASRRPAVWAEADRQCLEHLSNQLQNVKGKENAFSRRGEGEQTHLAVFLVGPEGD